MTSMRLSSNHFIVQYDAMLPSLCLITMYHFTPWTKLGLNEPRVDEHGLVERSSRDPDLFSTLLPLEFYSGIRNTWISDCETTHFDGTWDIDLWKNLVGSTSTGSAKQG